MPTLRRRSNRTGPRIRERVQPAPISASQELLMNQQKIMCGGMSLWSCTSQCAGNAASSTIHQLRTGVRRRAAIRIAFGGHNTETVCG